MCTHLPRSLQGVVHVKLEMDEWENEVFVDMFCIVFMMTFGHKYNQLVDRILVESNVFQTRVSIVSFPTLHKNILITSYMPKGS